MSSLIDLPVELFYSISAAISPADIVNLACSCKQLLESSKDFLARHKKLHSELGLVHDRDAITVPTVLRRVLDEPQAQWHIRKFEAWGSREGFASWKNYPLRQGHSRYSYLVGSWDDSERFPAWFDRWRNYTYINSAFFSEGELEWYRQVMLHELHLTEEDVKRWMDLLESGYDEPLKVILIALSERLRDFSLVTYRTIDNGVAEEDPLRMLSTSIRSIYLPSSPGSCQWPIGFRALRSIMISEFTQYRHRQPVFSSHSATIASLFLLPALRKLRLTLTGYDDGLGYVWEWDEGVSSVEDLELIIPRRQEKTFPGFISACRALRSVRYDWLFWQPLMRTSLLKHAKHTLEEVQINGEVSDSLSKNPDDFLARFDRLRHVSIGDAYLFNRETMGKYKFFDKRETESCKQIRAQWLDLRELMPKTLETLRILLTKRYWPLDRNAKHSVVAFCMMMEEFIRSKNTQTHVLENFRLLCATGLSTIVKSGPWKNTRIANDCFTSLKEECAKRDVEFHPDADHILFPCSECPQPKKALEPIPPDECPLNGVGEAPDPTTV